jgi:diguanylate cyclase (GGDEF)-like protein
MDPAQPLEEGVRAMGRSQRCSPAGGRWAADARTVDRLLLASGLTALVAVLWFFVNINGQVGPAALLWLPSPVAAVLLTLVFRRTAAAQHLPMPTRRFWRHLSIAAALVGAATVAQAYDALRHPGAGGQHTGVANLTLDIAAIMIIIYALFRLPAGARSRGRRLQVTLDASTVMLAAAIFFWRMLTARMISLGEMPNAVVLGAALVGVLALVAVAIFAVVKVMLSTRQFIDKSALQLFGLAMLVGATSPMPQGLLADRPYLLCTQAGIPVVMLIAAWAGERQRSAQSRMAGRSREAEPVERPYSVLPYIAVAAVDGLLLVGNWSEGGADQGVVVGAVGLTVIVVLRQLTAFQENRRLLVQLNHSATHDSLTQLPNRTLFGNRLHRLLASPAPGRLSVALIDLDDFKVVNDTLGHEIGDALLIAVADRLKNCVRPGDTIARLGGDEFVVVLDGADGQAGDVVIELIVGALAAPVVAGGHELMIRASIGIANGGTGDDASVLLRHADIAMYAAKKLDGTRYLHFEEGMVGVVATHAQLGTELRRAIADDQLFLLFQPIVALDDGELTGAEALVRWAHPERGTLAPADFIPSAEQSGLIVPLGHWVMRAACRRLAEWSATYGEAAPAVLNVNVSARELREPLFAEQVAEILAGAGLDPDRLMIEITETTALELGTSVHNLSRLRALGVRVALDDFGTGRSTLSLLHDCPVDELKLDRSFTQAREDGRPAVADAVLQLARTMKLDVVAEGVETPQQADRLRQLGYKTAQGYLFARPMPAHLLGDLLEKRMQLSQRVA